MGLMFTSPAGTAIPLDVNTEQPHTCGLDKAPTVFLGTRNDVLVFVCQAPGCPATFTVPANDVAALMSISDGS